MYHKNVETHLFDYRGELYGREIRVEFLKKLRDERKFENVEALSEEIQRNCISARQYHAAMRNDRKNGRELSE